MTYWDRNNVSKGGPGSGPQVSGSPTPNRRNAIQRELKEIAARLDKLERQNVEETDPEMEQEMSDLVERQAVLTRERAALSKAKQSLVDNPAKTLEDQKTQLPK